MFIKEDKMRRPELSTKSCDAYEEIKARAQQARTMMNTRAENRLKRGRDHNSVPRGSQRISTGLYGITFPNPDVHEFIQ